MTASRIGPTPEFLEEQFDRELDRILGVAEPAEAPLPTEIAERGAVVPYAPPLDLIATADAFAVHVELPGARKENIEVHIAGPVLTITGRREAAPEGIVLIRGRDVGKFARTLRFPAPIDAARAEVTFEDGILTVVVPKPAPTPGQTIVVR
ncbi:MAG TPA: Hsp20/alpha crystallin family protein [Gemmatimonadales bacterium]|nr:Hsp20/alpha crystallin family protein [Gemmatimonadales bacterium]